MVDVDIANSLWRYAVIALVTVVVWEGASIVYNLWLHPLRKFPGPVLQRASTLPWAIRHGFGNQAFHTQRLHERYGPVVRLGPNHLSFTDPRAWREIMFAVGCQYGHRVGDEAKAAGNTGSGSSSSTGGSEMPKAATFVKNIRAIPTSIINADRDEHSRFRRALSHGFSDAAMRQQEPLIARYVDLLLRRLHEICSKNDDDDNSSSSDDGKKGEGEGKKTKTKTKTPLNIEAWYNYATFDIVGELVFGHPFGCLERSDYHPWIAFIFGSVRAGAWTVALSYVGLGEVVQWVWSLGGLLAFAEMNRYIHEMLESRLRRGEEGGAGGARDDLFEGLVRRREEWNLSFEKLGSNAFILVLAGSETTATTLSGATYLLLTHPAALAALAREVRSAFASAADITLGAVSGSGGGGGGGGAKLPYMLAALNEALRLYPPVTSGLVRVVPAGGELIAGHYVPGGTFVEVQHWSINHSEDNWEDPWAFKPERFLAGDAAEAAKSGNRLEALQPFNVGPRNCIGRNLAYAEMRLILARIVYDFDLELADDSKNWIERQRAFALWDRIPLNVYLTPVKR
ncbi:hypothetical protein SLS62_010546 [Diatrype stigma]|uniref:Cytochrome P450 n=1 Tax=Diatrype stigma TaxID=117547 RepID=A0AAN9YG99_9PEZI